MGTLAAALEWAKRGFPVFPVQENSKEPVFDDWPSSATIDEKTIIAMWTDPVFKTERNYNIGCLTSNLVVIDIDVKKGKHGYEEYNGLGGTFDTLLVQTPTGGVHCYFYGPSSSNTALSPSVDVRSKNGYVLAPGSTIDGKPYSVITDLPIKWIPQSLETRLTPAYYKEAAVFSGTESLDSPSSIEAAISYLSTCPPAIQGQHGDETTFKTAARLVREMGLTPQTAYCLLRDYYNPRCVPPWHNEELVTKVYNAMQYGTASTGSLTPDHFFGSILHAIEKPPNVFETANSWGNAVDPALIPARPWVVNRMLMRKSVTLLMASGSAGKSSLSLALASHLALGKDFAGNKSYEACKSIVYNGEDNLIEQSRRLEAVCSMYNFNYKEVKDSIFMLSNREVKLDLVYKNGKHVYKNDIIYNQLRDIAIKDEVGLLVLDPLVKVHKCEESDNVEMDFVMDVINDLAYEANIAVLILHHTSKTGNQKQSDRIGNMDIGRGASSIVNASRIAYTLLNPSDEDTETYGFSQEEKYKYIRLDDAKMNFSLATDKATWFKREGVKIRSGDVVGVVKYEDIKRSNKSLQTRLGIKFKDFFLLNNKADMTMREAVNYIKNVEPVWSNKTDKYVAQKLEGLFKFGMQIDDCIIKSVREHEGEKTERVYIRKC